MPQRTTVSPQVAADLGVDLVVDALVTAEPSPHGRGRRERAVRQALLELSATGQEMSEYHVEAAIAWCHVTAPSARSTNWGQVVSLYDTLMAMRPSLGVALSRAIAVAQHEGPESGLAALRAIPDRERLRAYPFYPIALGEFELRCGRHAAARDHFTVALPLARNAAEQSFIEQRIAACSSRS